MVHALAETTPNAEAERPVHRRPTALLIATDGTPQSDAAIALAHLLPLGDQREVKVLTVVDHTPIPWGAIDRSLVMDYERGLHQEAQNKAKAQIARLGDKSWPVEVRSGDPATTIAALAKESRSRIVVVGLGDHGAAARFLGNETALRLMRVSEVPVLAVDSKLRELPRRIVVAMDFSEPSIEAARLALEIAAPGAIVTLVHVVPWERKDYIPEHWFKEHEAYVGAQLTRVTGWLDQGTKCRISLSPELTAADYSVECSVARLSRSWFEGPGVLCSFFPRPPRSSASISWRRSATFAKSMPAGQRSSMSSPAETRAVAEVSRSMIPHSAHRSK
jgi:nucleotide-binding universal stress UspA family protein